MPRLLVLVAAAIVAAASVALPALAAEVNGGEIVHVMPLPQHLTQTAGCRADFPAGISVAAGTDAGARDLVDERWRALGLPPLHDAQGSPTVTVGRDARLPPQAYRLDIAPGRVRIAAAGDDGVFYAFATLAQLGYPGRARGLALPCVSIEDAPVLAWRVLSDDVSRGPLPTVRYFEERIRTIASFKMNGYSPYMEHVFADPRHPLPAPLDGITPAELHALALYARRFHVAFIPEQQTFAHMHETLKFERYADLAELPHGYLLSPASPGGQAYVRDLIADELAAVPRPPFFHIGSDEPSDLGRGASAALVAHDGEGTVYAKHVVDTANYVIASSAARPMIWDDALSRHPELFGVLPKSLVFVNWHYGAEPSYAPFIARIAGGGFEQMVAPGALNWNEFYPDLDHALINSQRFITEGKSAHVLGLFQTVWHDDGESLFEASWIPVIFSAANAWSATEPREQFLADLPWTLFGTHDARYATDVAALGAAHDAIAAGHENVASDYLFWSDPFVPPAGFGDPQTYAALRRIVEPVMEHLRVAPPPPLHANAAAVVAFAARRYDALGREYQIAREARAYYDDALANAALKHVNYVYRGLGIAKYLMWEQRDTMLQLQGLARATWEYEDRASHEASVLERYRRAADIAIGRADRIDSATRERYERGLPMPSFDEVLGLAPAPVAPSPAPSASPSH